MKRKAKKDRWIGATWDPQRELWMEESSEQWEPFLETFPTSGTMRSGKLSPLPASEPLTAESGYSYLPTPQTAYTASSAEEWRARRPAGNGKVREQLGDLQLAVTDLLPTPRAQNASPQNDKVWPRPLNQPQNLENALARIPMVEEQMRPK